MVNGDQKRFAVSCPACGLSRESEELTDAAQFASKHNEHTGHTCRWDRAELETEVDVELGTVWIVTCDECLDEWKFSSEKAAQDWYDDHVLYTDHYANEPECLGEHVDGVENMDKIIRAYESTGQFENGVPVPLILSELENHDITQSVADAEIQKMRRRGIVYEPKTGHIRLT